MNDPALEQAKKRIKENRVKLGIDPAPAQPPDEPTPAATPPETPPAQPPAEPVSQTPAEPVVAPQSPAEPVQTPPVEPPVAEPTPTSEPDAKDAEIAHLKALVDEQRKKLNDRDGQHGAAIQTMRNEIAALSERLEKAESRHITEPEVDEDPLAEAKIQAAIKRMPKTVRDRFDEQYLRDLVSNDIIVSMARGGDSSQDDLRQRVEDIGKTQQELAAERWLGEADRTAAAAGAEGFLTANQSDESWGKYLGQPVLPGSAMTRKQFLEQPDTQPRAAAEMFIQFKGATATPAAAPTVAAPQPGPQRPSLQELVTKRPSAAPGRSNAPRTMTRAEYERRREAAANANGDPAKRAAFDEARRFLLEGRVSG